MPIVNRSDARITRTAATTRQGRSAAPFFRADERLAERDAVPPSGFVRLKPSRYDIVPPGRVHLYFPLLAGDRR